jgi:cyclic pyranopterin phosphate synthase
VSSQPTSTAQSRVLDRLARPLHDLRISVTDRCNFRCGYCMPRDVFHDGYAFMPRADVLTFEEIERVARLFVERLGARKLRLTGGEPLLRRDLVRLVDKLARIQGVEDIALTTNGLLLAEHAASLANAGLRRVTVSLDALDAATFGAMAGLEGDASGVLARVLAGMDAAETAGLRPLKINCVVQRGFNEHAIEALARHFRGSSRVVRFIEFMDVGTLNAWSMERVVPAEAIRASLEQIAPLAAIVDPRMPDHVAERFRFTDDGSEVGIIASVTRPFCGTCTRARLSADGRFLSCLFASQGTDLRARLRGGESDLAIGDMLVTSWRDRGDRYSEQRAGLPLTPLSTKRRLEMYQVGG